MKKLIPYFKKFKFHFIFSFFLIIFVSALFALNPYLEGLITTNIFENFNNGNPFDGKYIGSIIIVLIVSYTVIALSRLTFNFLLTTAIQKSMRNLRNDVQRKIHKMPIRYFDNHAVGDIMSRMSTDVETLGNGLQQAFSAILSSVLTILFILGFMFALKWQMALISLAMFPVIFLLSKIILAKSKPLYTKRYETYGVLAGHLQEQYTGFKEITLYNKQDDAAEMFEGVMFDLSDYVFKSDFISGLLTPLISSVIYITLVLMITIGASLAIKGVIVVGTLQTFVKYTWRLGNPLNQITQMSILVQSSMAAADRVFEFLDEEEETQDIKEPKVIEDLKGRVEFKNVDFSYYKNRPILRDVSFVAEPGEMIAIVGPTGSGKTTIINLLMRFYDINSGEILLDGVNINNLKKEDLRTHFGMVLQDTWLFNGTIADNIRYGKDDAPIEDVIKAAKLAKIHHYISTLPSGYDMEINEEGDNISQGEKQLMTIARAFLADPAILILDEATSTVDTRLEMMLQEAMRNIMENRTSFVIAHRLSTIKNADKIIVLKDGEIIEIGNHDELMSKKGFYEQLYNSQFEES